MNSTLTIRTDFTVDLVQAQANDDSVMWAAKISTLGERSQLRVAEDFKNRTFLIRYLMKNRHGTPFEHNLMTFYVEAPIFVFREMMRHRIGISYNEESARYKELSPVFYVPGFNRPLVQTGKTGYYKHEAGSEELTYLATSKLGEAYAVAYRCYQDMIAEGVTREVARSCLPVGTYVSAYVTMNARSLMHFLSLRTEGSAVPSHPQWEIAQVAAQMEAHWCELMPVTAEAFDLAERMAP